MNTAHAGRRAEHMVREIFERAGFTVMRAAGSRGIADLVAIREAEPILPHGKLAMVNMLTFVAINVKAGRGWPPPEERAEMRTALPSAATCLLVRVPKIRKEDRAKCLKGLKTPSPEWRILDDEGQTHSVLPGWLLSVVEPQPVAMRVISAASTRGVKG